MRIGGSFIRVAKIEKVDFILANDKMSSGSGSDDDWHTDEDEGDEEIFAPEINVFERVGLPGAGLLGMKATTRAEKMAMDPLERFRIAVDAISRQLDSWGEVTIHQDSITAMLEAAAALRVVEHKNPTAYILGYLATGGGKKLEQKHLTKVLTTVLPRTESGSVEPPDVIRYARLWENL
mgnify:CR=1 FL=1